MNIQRVSAYKSVQPAVNFKGYYKENVKTDKKIEVPCQWMDYGGPVPDTYRFNEEARVYQPYSWDWNKMDSIPKTAAMTEEWTTRASGSMRGNHYTKDYMSKTIIEPSLTREESLTHILKGLTEEARGKENNKLHCEKRAAELAEESRNQGIVSKITSSVKGLTRLKRSVQPQSPYAYAEAAKGLTEQIDAFTKAETDLRRQIAWNEGERDALALARKTGVLVDVSRRDVKNPDQPLYDFLADAKKHPGSLDWVRYEKISLPTETMNVADAVLISLGNKKEEVLKQSYAAKAQMVQKHINDSNFLEKVKAGFEVNLIL